MRQIVLSDFTGDMIAQSEQERKNRYAAAMDDYVRRFGERKQRVQLNYENALAEYDQRAAQWGTGGFGTKLRLGLLHPGKILKLLSLCLVGGAGVGFAAHLALGSYGELSGLVTASCVALLYIAFLTRRPVAPSLDTFERQMPVLRAPVIEAALSDDQRWKAGNDGENRVTAHLSAALSDEWTLLSGYYGPGGEIDRILVGPMGVCAIEVKHLNGCVHVMADNWQMDRYDKYGNIVERARPIANKAKMSPSSQVNRAVAPLERFLDRRKSVKRVRRAVVLTHDRSRVGSVQDLTVDHVSTLEALSLAKLFPAGAQFDAAEVSVAVKLIEGDHAYQERKRNSRGTAARRRRR